MGGEFRRGDDLHLQPDAEIADRALRDRLCHAEGGPVAADQLRRLRSDGAEDRPEGEGGVQADRRRTTALLHYDLSHRHVACGDQRANQLTISSRRRSAMLAAESPNSLSTSSACCPSMGGGRPGLRSAPTNVTGWPTQFKLPAAG